ncbi:MAG: hypothetical protein JRF63_12335, partial [Deltaproteobacteria bacterium]|nr:hypothetical protein [Deltaproteobacteria bacterium]
MSYAGIWLLHIGVLGILDAKLFAKPPEGERKIGTLVWGIVILAVAGLTALLDLRGLVNLMMFIEMLSYNPASWILDFLGAAVEVTLCVFLILGGVSRIRNRAPGKAVLKIILGCCLAGLGLTSLIAQPLLGGGYY